MAQNVIPRTKSCSASPRRSCAGGGEALPSVAAVGGSEMGLRRDWSLVVCTPSGARFGKQQGGGCHPAFSLIPFEINAVLFPKRLFFFSFFPPCLILMVKAKPGAHSSVALMVQAPSTLTAHSKRLFKGKPSFPGVLRTSGQVDALEDH